MLQLRPKPLAGFGIDPSACVCVCDFSPSQTPCGIYRHRPCGFLETSLDITNLSILHTVFVSHQMQTCGCVLVYKIQVV